MAAISTSRAITQSEMLRYSRSREAEADRVGIDTLIEAGMNPQAMAHMFERLNRANRFSGRNVPEFLLTHPVTKSRIADSYAQTERLPKEDFDTSLDFQLMRARVHIMTATSHGDAIGRMKTQLTDDDKIIRTAARYGLSLAQAEDGQLDNSMRNITGLRQDYPGKITFIVAEADLHLKALRYDSAIGVLEDALKITPNNYPLSVTYAEALMKVNRARDAAIVLATQTEARPNDKDLWYLLAEAHGLAQDIVDVHLARAEYFVLVGNFEQALKQLGFAKPMVRDNFQESSRLQQRTDEIYAMLVDVRRS